MENTNTLHDRTRRNEPQEHGLTAYSSYFPPMAGLHANQLQQFQNPIETSVYLGDGGFMKRKHGIIT